MDLSYSAPSHRRGASASCARHALVVVCFGASPRVESISGVPSLLCGLYIGSGLSLPGFSIAASVRSVFRAPARAAQVSGGVLHHGTPGKMDCRPSAL